MENSILSLCAVCLVAQPCLTLCNSIDCRAPSSSVHGILQARIVEWVAIPYSIGFSQPRDQTQVSCIAGRFFTNWAMREALCNLLAAKSLQLYLTLCDPIDGSPPGSPVPGILQARTLEWVAISFSNAWKWKVKVKVKSCPTLSDRVDCSLPGSSVHETFEAREPEWGAIAFSAVRCLSGSKCQNK